MLRHRFNEIRVGRIPTGEAALGAEAIESSHNFSNTDIRSLRAIGSVLALETVSVEDVSEHMSATDSTCSSS